MSQTNGKNIVCRDCSYGFYFSDAEKTFYESKNFLLPVRCITCRNAKKTSSRMEAMPQHKNINCSDCSKEFHFSVGAQNHYKENGWEDPTRCNDCRTKHKSLTPLSICCNICKNDFIFSIKSQKSYTKNQWKYPVRCRPCHDDYKKKMPEEKMPNLEIVETSEKADEKTE